MPKNPLYVDKIIISGNDTDGGIFMADGTSVVDSSGNIDAPVTSTNLTLSGTLSVTGASTLTGAVGCAASITLGAGTDLIGSSTSDITINTNKFTVAGATGNTLIAGTLDLDGAAQIDATVTVGVDDTGYDVKLFGATAGSYLLWDESADALIVNAGTVDCGTSCEADAYTVGGSAGADFSGAVSNITVVKGIVTAAS